MKTILLPFGQKKLELNLPEDQRIVFNGMFQKVIISHLHFCEWLWSSVYIYFMHFRITCAESVLYKPVEVRHCLLFF